MAYPAWRATSAIARANILYKAAELLFARVNEIGAELTREEGKTLKEGIGETTRAMQILRYFAGELQQPTRRALPVGQSARRCSTRCASRLGWLPVITPWNFPIAIPAWKIAPALAFGNTVVLKPASLTPLCAVRLIEVLHEAGIPQGVVNLVTGSAGDVGDPLVRDARVARSRSPDRTRSATN